MNNKFSLKKSWKVVWWTHKLLHQACQLKPNFHAYHSYSLLMWLIDYVSPSQAGFHAGEPTGEVFWVTYPSLPNGRVFTEVIFSHSMVPMLVDHQSRFPEKSQVLGSASFQSVFITLAHLQLRLLGIDCILSAHYFTGSVLFFFSGLGRSSILWCHR